MNDTSVCESDSTHPKCAEGSLRMLKMRTASGRERFDPPKVRRGFGSLRVGKMCTAPPRERSTRPKCAEGSLSTFKMCTAPQRERFDPPKVRRGHFAFQHAHRATARAIHPKCAEGSLCSHFAFAECAPRHSESDCAPPIKCAKGSLCIFKKCTAPQREQYDPPKVLRLPRHRRASSKVLRLPRNLHEKL